MMSQGNKNLVSLVQMNKKIMSQPSYSWSIAIFAARESTAVLAASIRAALAACKGRSAIINVLINGNQALAQELATMVDCWDSGSCDLQLWSISTPDKAHTWNEYAHRIWTPGSLAFFVDGYARVMPDAFREIEQHLVKAPESWCASGVPTCGRSATSIREEMLRSGGIHGNLYSVSSKGMESIRTTGFRLPLGLYRTDPLLGAALIFRLDPANNTWEPKRITVVATATWQVDNQSLWSLQSIQGQLKRMVRQAQGELENRAAREHMAIKRLAPQFLPKTAKELITHWLDEHPAQARALFKQRPLTFYAAKKVRGLRDWSSVSTLPLLVRSKIAGARSE